MERLSQWARDNGLGLDIEACFGDDPSDVHYMVLGRKQTWFVEPSHKEVILELILAQFFWAYRLILRFNVSVDKSFVEGFF